MDDRRMWRMYSWHYPSRNDVAAPTSSGEPGTSRFTIRQGYPRYPANAVLTVPHSRQVWDDGGRWRVATFALPGMQFCLLLRLLPEAAVTLPAQCKCGSYRSASNEGKRQEQAFIDSHELFPCMKSCDQRGSLAEPSAGICLPDYPCLCGRETSVMGTVDKAWHFAKAALYSALCVPWGIRTAWAAAGFTSNPDKVSSKPAAAH